ncbi:MAG: dihydroneopterin aldolase [Thermoleophilia bacterium]|nr:dihydroneopterin aldolase [Thermoleophilia bacterium]
MSDRWTVSLEGIEIFGHHGVYPAERELGQRFVVDLDLELSECPAGATDALEDTVDYAALADLVAEMVGGKPVALLEHLASRLADAVLERDGRVAAATVTVHKPEVAIPHPLAEARVRLRRERP